MNLKFAHKYLNLILLMNLLNIQVKLKNVFQKKKNSFFVTLKIFCNSVNYT